MIYIPELYHKEPYLKEFDAEVVKCEEKNGLYSIILKETAFYPEGGGQGCDFGYIGEAYVSDVHVVSGEITHIADKEVSPGETYTAKLDWQRRFSHMQHHTAEHIVSGVINKIYGADNVGFHLNGRSAVIDFSVLLNENDIIKIEELSNEAIYKNLKVKADYYDNPPEINYRSKKEISGLIRIVTIDGYDACACCGTQTDFTGEIGLIKITDFHKHKGGTRVYMVCGSNALKDYQVKHRNITGIQSLVSAKPEEAEAAVSALLEEKKQLVYEMSKIKTSLYKLRAESVAESDKLCLFFEDYGMDDLIKYGSFLTSKAPIIALFSEGAKGYKYVVYCEGLDLRQLAKDINAALNGKGGGRDFISGTLNASKAEIEEFFNDLELR